MRTLYIHIPFCKFKCFYCSFVVNVAQEKRMTQYVSSLELEMKSHKNNNIDHVYFGGGTPTLLDEENLQRLLNGIRKNFSISKDAEITIEINPETVTESLVQVLIQGGVNRVSLGIQSFNNRILKFLGRTHEEDQIIKAYHVIKGAGMNNISFDFIFSIPGQSIDDLKQDLIKLINFDLQHVSLYSLTVEKNSKFYARNMILPENDYQIRQYELICGSLENFGLCQYEISNFSKIGYESKHNINYWTGGEYHGLGVGAHSHIDGERFWNIKKLTEYIDKLNRGVSIREGSEKLSPVRKLEERLLFGLRMNAGVKLKDLESESQASLSSFHQQKIDQFIKDGFLENKNNCLRTTFRGKLLLDEISAQLIE